MIDDIYFDLEPNRPFQSSYDKRLPHRLDQRPLGQDDPAVEKPKTDWRKYACWGSSLVFLLVLTMVLINVTKRGKGKKRKRIRKNPNDTWRVRFLGKKGKYRSARQFNSKAQAQKFAKEQKMDGYKTIVERNKTTTWGKPTKRKRALVSEGRYRSGKYRKKSRYTH